MNVFTTNLKIQTQTSRVLKLHLTRQQITGCAQVSSIYGDNYVILKLYGNQRSYIKNIIDFSQTGANREIGQQMSCCATSITPSLRGNFVARKVGIPYLVAIFTIQSKLSSSTVRALIDPNNPSTNLHSRIRIENIQKEKDIFVSGNTENNRMLPVHDVERTTVTNHYQTRNVSIERTQSEKNETSYGKENSYFKSSDMNEVSSRGSTHQDFIDLFLSISPKSGYTNQKFHSSFLRPGDWIISDPTSPSKLFRVPLGYVNDKSQWDPNKLGWFRILPKNGLNDNDSIDLLRHTPIDILQKHLFINLRNCQKQQFQASFHGISEGTKIPLHPLDESNVNKYAFNEAKEQEYKYRIRKSTRILSILPNLSVYAQSHKLRVNLATVASKGPFLLFPSPSKSVFAKLKIDESFNASVEVDKDNYTWLLLNLGNTCGRFLTGDVRHQAYRHLLTR